MYWLFLSFLGYLEPPFILSPLVNVSFRNPFTCNPGRKAVKHKNGGRINYTFCVIQTDAFAMFVV